MEKITILIIEDEPTINRIISNYFIKENYSVLNALDGAIGLKLFRENKVDLVCLDIMLPEIDGWDVAKKIREDSDVPIIMMSALSTEEDILKGYSLKIDDYVTKPFNPKILVAKIKNLLERIEKSESDNRISGILEVEGIKMNMSTFEDNRKIKELLTLDDLTGVANRRYLELYLKNMKEEVEKFDSSFGILFFDIDHFKNINDVYGHSVGDEILKLISHTINSNIRAKDLFGRWGGEEFIAVIKTDSILELEIIAKKLKILVSNAYYELEDSKRVSVTISIGGTMFQKSEEIAMLIYRADANMYLSKEKGRNLVTIK